MKGVAFKVTYNDGGAVPGGLVGYRGVCSNRVMLDNIRVRGMTNCSAENGPCRSFVDANFMGTRPSNVLAAGAEKKTAPPAAAMWRD